MYITVFENMNQYRRRGFIGEMTEIINSKPEFTEEQLKFIAEVAQKILDGLAYIIPDFIIEWIKSFISTAIIVLISFIILLVLPPLIGLYIIYRIVKKFIKVSISVFNFNSSPEEEKKKSKGMIKTLSLS